MRMFPTINLDSGTIVKDKYNWLTLTVVKTAVDPSDNANIMIIPVESFSGSLKYGEKNKSTGESVYLPDIVNAQSQFIKCYGNPNTVIDTGTVYAVADRSYVSMSVAPETTKTVTAGALLAGMQACLAKVTNIDEYQLDTIVDAGLSNIAQYGADAQGKLNIETAPTASGDVDKWRAVIDELAAFCSVTRKDCMTIVDTPRACVLDGNEKYQRKTKPTNTFSNTIGKYVKYATGTNNSYVAQYSNWTYMFDKNRGVSTWFPPSIKTVGVYLRTERLANMWDAPAGINRGNLPGVADLAFNPANDAEASQIYTKYINFAKQYPIEGFTLEGQKTTRTGDNAFNRVNVRRLLLRLERFVYQTLRQFIYEPNNVFTRRRAIASLDPTFSSVQSRGGLYAYKLVIDETNNTPDVIDRNEMRVAILVQPVKTAEFILVDMIVTRTGANFDEVLQEVL